MGRIKPDPKKTEFVIAAAVLLAGALLRVLLLGRFPPGLNQDEASIGYDAWSLLVSGIDRNGAAWPVLLTSWGSGQNVLYAYLSFPFLRLFGRTVPALRLCAAFWGSFSLLFFWLLARRALGRTFGLPALLLLALDPWHLLLSRWALESNLLPAFLLLGTLFLCRVREKPRLLYAASAAYALGLYAYGTAFLFLPVFLLCASVRILRRKYVPLRHWLGSLLLFALIAFPLALCQLRNALGLPEMKLLWMTLPALTETRQAATVSFSLKHLAALGRLLWRQTDGLPWNSAGPFGLFYGVPGLLAALAGLTRMLVRAFRRELKDAEACALFSLLAGFFAALFIDVNVNRVNFLFLPIVWCQAEGLLLLRGRLRFFLPPCLAALVIAAAFMGRWYVTKGAETLGPAFHEGLLEAIGYAESLEPESVWVTGEVNMPYVYVLFGTGTPAEEFLDTVQYLNPRGAFRRVTSFGKYRFYGSPEGEIRILPRYQASSEETLAVFGGYAVVRGENP